MQTYTNIIMNETLCSSENNRNTFTQPSLTIQTTLTSPNNNTYNNHDNDEYDDDNQSQTQTEMETQSQTQTLHKFDVPLQFPFSPPPPPLAPPSAEPAGFGAAGLSAFPNTRTKKYENPNGLFTYFTPEGMSLNTHTIDNVIVSLKYKDLCKKYKIKTYEENELVRK